EMDHKTLLQEVIQRKGDVSIEIRLIKEEGPAHDPTFFTEVYMNGELIGFGEGKSM
ncbi:putative dsRNA-binding protein, partial [Enterococcus faecalis]|uniref:putative dsRNA-binding protein n=1 Tax=Enterococcus faecalis TaxID=1351 RepID=UPI003CC563FB